MSTVESLYATIFHHLKHITNLSQQERLLFFNQTYTFLGSPFMKALTLLEYSPKRIQITQYEHFFSLKIDKETNLILKEKHLPIIDKSTKRIFEFALECDCQEGFNKKCQKKAPFLCFHLILMYMIQLIPDSPVKIQKGFSDNLDELGEILLAIKQ